MTAIRKNLEINMFIIITLKANDLSTNSVKLIRFNELKII